MSLFLILYITVLVAMVYIYAVTYKVYIHLFYGRFFLLGLVFYFLWFLFYLLAFSTTIDVDYLLIISRLLYALSLIAMYCMTGYFLFFGRHKYSPLFKRNTTYITLFFILCILGVSVFSGYIIEAMIYDPALGFHYEQFGVGFDLFSILYLLNPILTLSIILFVSKRLRGINKIRYSYISLGYLFFIFSCVFILIILPLFGIWVLQKEQVLFFIPFLLLFYYSCYRYKFFELGVGISKVLNVILPLMLSIGCVLFVKKYFSERQDMVNSFWGNYYIFGITEMLLAVFLFFLFRKLGRKYFIKGDIVSSRFSNILEEGKQKIPHLMDLFSVNQYLNGELSKKLDIGGLQINSFPDENYKQLGAFFSCGIQNDILLNDYVFLSENKNKFQLVEIQKELDSDILLYIALRDRSNTLIGFLGCGKKSFTDTYSFLEIDMLKNLARFLEGHVKYISIYSQIHDLNLNLDKKVDEKTIKYNNLINKQKEFIGYVSHEIKNPLTNALFLSDSLRGNIGTISDTDLKQTLEEDVGILNKELLKIGELTHKIFSVESYDLDKVKLFREYTNMYGFLNEEIESFRETYPDVVFDIRIQQVGNHEFDRIQFRQVVQNLIGNAIKFANTSAPTVQITLKTTSEGQIIFCVEDNGNSFSEIDTLRIFDKYMTGESSSIGLGLGLYLCKRIVELHGWSIQASVSQELGGAKCTITIV